MTFDDLLNATLDEAPFFVAVAIIVWLSAPQLAERFTLIGKLLRPLSKRWQEKSAQLEAQRRTETISELRTLALEVIKEIAPPDVKRMEDRMAGLGKRLDRAEDAEELLRAFVIYDELWHFNDDANEARHGRRPQVRMTFDVFEEKWREGWRPFDEHGRLVDDGTAAE